MTKFRKKPVVIEAVQWFKNGDHPKDDSEWFDARKTEGKLIRYYRNPADDAQRLCENCDATMHRHGWIDTREGGHIVCPADWIITGVKGEHFPCKPDIFEETYESVE